MCFFSVLIHCLIYALFCITRARYELRTHQYAHTHTLINASAPRGGALGCPRGPGDGCVCCCSARGGREKRQPRLPACWRTARTTSAVEGDCRWWWWLELNAECAPHLLLPRVGVSVCFSVFMCYLSGNVQITKIVSSFFYTAAAVVVFCVTRCEHGSWSSHKSIANCQLAGRRPSFTHVVVWFWFNVCVRTCSSFGQGFVFILSTIDCLKDFNLSGRDSRGVFDLNYIFNLMTVFVVIIVWKRWQTKISWNHLLECVIGDIRFDIWFMLCSLRI